MEPKRPPRPVNITAQVKLSPTVANHISVSWCTEYNRGYAVACYLVRKLSSAQLLQRLKTKGVKAADYTRALSMRPGFYFFVCLVPNIMLCIFVSLSVKEKLNEDADCEIATTMLKVSLICPLGKMRMTTPCRSVTTDPLIKPASCRALTCLSFSLYLSSSTCSHLQCFDASLYLQMNERKPTWNCPVCDKPAVYNNLVIDG